MKPSRNAIIFIAAYALSAASGAETCTVFAVTDGDTIKVRCEGGGQVTVRVAAIDAPEQAQPFGQRSKQALSALCFRVEATLTRKNKDRYGRTVADVSCSGKDVGTELVGTGMAWVYDKYAQRHTHLYPLQDAARAARVGLWADTGPVAPWVWRLVKISTTAPALRSAWRVILPPQAETGQKLHTCADT